MKRGVSGTLLHGRLEGRNKCSCCPSYDATGRTDELKFDEAGEAGWDAYFEDLFERFDRKALDEDKAKYQGRWEAQKLLC